MPAKLPWRLEFGVNLLVTAACQNIFATLKWKEVTLLSYLYV